MNESFWKQFPPIPGFDCVKMKHAIQEQIHEAVKGMTSAQRLDYYRRGAAEFRAAHARGPALAVHEDAPKYGGDQSSDAKKS